MNYEASFEEHQKEDYDPFWDEPTLFTPLPEITISTEAASAVSVPFATSPVARHLPDASEDKSALPPDIRALCVKEIGFYSRDLIVRLNKQKTKVSIERNLVNVVEALRQHPALVCNQYSYSILCQEEQINGHPATDDLLIDLMHTLTKVFRKDVSKDTVCNAISKLCNANKRNEVKEYFEGLPMTTTTYIDIWLTTFLGVQDSELVRVIGRKWLLSAVARAYQPGCHVEGMLVLEGPGGTGKSHALRILCPKDEWFSSSKLDFANEKETAEKLRGIFLHENAELAGLSKSDQNVVKAWATNTKDTFRESYARKSKSVPRMMVAAGSTNDETYLADRTGENRRFWGVKIGTIDIQALVAAKEALWREAVDAYKAGKNAERLWTLTQDEIQLLGESNDERMILDPIEENLRTQLANEDKVSTGDLFDTYLNNKRFASKDLPNIMRRLGFTKGRFYNDDGKQVRGYTRKPSETAIAAE